MSVINLSPFNRKRPLVLAISIIMLLAADSQAEITTDGTLGPALNLNGPDYKIGQELGLTVGKNLFHSFDCFNVPSGKSATFTGPDTLDNVISRVTGGSVSTIDGLLRSEVGTADFYFINPAGVVFGPNARVEVPAAFHVSTADELRFAGGAVFSAVNPAASTLTAAAPESFGYLGPRVASLVVNGSKLEFAPQSTVSLSGGEVLVQGGDINTAKVVVPDGELRIYAAGNTPGEMPLTGDFEAGGGRFDAIQATIKTSGDGGGELRIGAGEATVANSTLAANNFGAPSATNSGHAGTVKMRVAGLLEVVNGGIISSDTYGSGNAGSVEIEAGSLRIDGQGSNSFTCISSDANPGSSGMAGSVTITSENLLEILNGGIISSDTYASGNAGSVELKAGNLRVDGQGSWIQTLAYPETSGNAGTVTISVADLLEVLNDGQISSVTYGAGKAGEVRIEAGNLRVDGQGSRIQTGTVFGSSGNAGTVTISVTDRLVVLNGGRISSSTFESGNAGKVDIEAGTLAVLNGGQILSITYASGNAGTITIRVAELLEVLTGGVISSETRASGAAGKVEIEAGNLRIAGGEASDFTGIWSDAAPYSSGNAGTVAIKVADLLEVLNGGQISSATYGSGNAGEVEIEAGNLRIAGEAASDFTGIWSDTVGSSSGNAGTVTIKVADLLEVLNGGQISSDTYGTGDAGDVEIEAERLRIDRQGADAFTGITSRAVHSSLGNAGAVTIRATNLLEILSGGQILSSTFASGNAGRVEIQAGELLIDGQEAASTSAIVSASLNSVESNQGFAGDVDIEAGKLTIRNGGAISIESHQSVSEEKRLQAEKAHLRINGGEIILGQDALISAQSMGNVPAATIDISADNIRISGNSSITTSANEADGGTITLEGDVIDLRDSLISSSVEGLAGNGGNITLKGPSASARALILESGFIQANAPNGAAGGDIFIDARAVIPEGGSLEVGGEARQTFEPGSGRNIIQAAAPGGEQGTIRITSPELDISASIVSLDTQLTEIIRLAADPCFSADSAEGSSLIFAGSGGVPAGPNQHATLFFEEDRLDRIMTHEEKREYSTAK
jgi:filamentous hemagglutinin family protein